MADKILAQELVSYCGYDKSLEYQRLVPWINNLAQKKVKGIFKKDLAEKGLADHVAKDAGCRYGGKDFRVDKETRALFGKMLLKKLMPRINRTAARMKKVGLNKGKIVMDVPKGNWPRGCW